MSTPNGTRVFTESPDGKRVDVTDGVQTLYDMCVSSMDWGSGFLSVEDATGIIRIAQTCGFLMPDTAAQMFEDYIRNGNSAYQDGMGNLRMPRAGTAQCSICNSPIFYLPDYYKDKGLYERWGRRPGWSHVDQFLDGGHAVKLWADK
jgi:hypothetical protein